MNTFTWLLRTRSLGVKIPIDTFYKHAYSGRMDTQTTTKETTMRDAMATLLSPAMKLTGFRFSTDYRHAVSGPKAWVYRHVNTVLANSKAGL